MSKSDLKFSVNDLGPLDLNAFEHLGPGPRLAVINFLDEVHTKKVGDSWTEEGKTKEEIDLACGIETILQILGAPGYEYT